MEDNYFKLARKKAGLTSFDAAVRLGVTPSAVSGWERGQCPRLSLADKIAEVYGLRVPELLRVMKEMAEATASAK